nr:hypothetical protein CFP56_00212 [Quercus suber]
MVRLAVEISFPLDGAIVLSADVLKFYPHPLAGLEMSVAYKSDNGNPAVVKFDALSNDQAHRHTKQTLEVILGLHSTLGLRCRTVDREAAANGRLCLVSIKPDATMFTSLESSCANEGPPANRENSIIFTIDGTVRTNVEGFRFCEV